MVRALLPDAPRPPKFHPELPFLHFVPYLRLFQFVPYFVWLGRAGIIAVPPQYVVFVQFLICLCIVVDVLLSSTFVLTGCMVYLC